MSRKSFDDKPVEIRIDLPLPTDVVSTLLKAIGLTYPSTQIARDGHTFKHERQLVLQIDQKERHKSAKAKKRYEEIRDYADGWVGYTTELGPGNVSIGPHELLVKQWCELARDSFNEYPSDTNYLETEVTDPETNERYVFCVSKGKDRTPHALRMQAEEKVKSLEARLEQKENQ